MNGFTRAFISMLLLTAVGLSAGCSLNSQAGTFDHDKFWEEQERNSPAAAA